MDKEKFPGGCDYKHTAADYAAAKAKSGGGGAGVQKSKGPGVGPKGKGAGKGHLICRVCKNKLEDKAAHPNGRFCVDPPETTGPKAKPQLASNAAGKDAVLMFEESDSEGEPQAEEELSALTAEGLMDMQVALKKVRSNGRDTSFHLEDRLSVLSSVLGIEMESRSLDDLPVDQFDHSRKPRHAGYHAWTRLVFSRLAVPMLLDSGATTNAMWEEVVMAIIAETLRAFTSGELNQKSERYPIVKIYKYADKTPLSGVMAKASAATQYAVVLRTQFVPDGEVEGPYRDIYYKILPAGSTNMSVGGILGMPVLDVQPYGLGWRVCPTVHVFDALGVSLARGE